MSDNKQNLHSITQQEETIMSNKNNPGVVVLQNGQTMSIADYIKGAPEQEAPRKLYLGKITNISNLASGRYFITPCWDKATGDDNKVAYVSCNKKLPAEQIVVGLPVAFSVVEERKHPGKYMALDVQPYQAGIEVITERPDNFPTNVSKSRQAYLDSLHQPVQALVTEKVEEVVTEPVVADHDEANLAVDNGAEVQVKVTTTLQALEATLAQSTKPTVKPKKAKKRKVAKVEDEDELEDDEIEFDEAFLAESDDSEVAYDGPAMSIYSEAELAAMEEDEGYEEMDEDDVDEYDEYDEYYDDTDDNKSTKFKGKEER